MPASNEKNIFEAATKQFNKKKLDKSKSLEKAEKTSEQSSLPNSSEPSPPSPPPPPPPPRQVKKKTNLVVDPETREMLEQIRQMKQDLQNKLELIQKKGGALGYGFKQFTQNKKNFTPEQWEDIQKAKRLLGDKIWNAIGKPAPPSLEQSQADSTTPSISPPVPGDRKGKTLGARKKWIPMR